MLTNNNNCSTPAQNTVYNSEACFYAQGRSLQNLTNIGVGGIGVFHGKFNDIAGLFNLAAGNASIVLTQDTVNKLINFNVQISASPGNSISLNPDGLFATGGSGTGDVVGPASAVNDNIAVFDGVTGKLIKDGGTTIAAINIAIGLKLTDSDAAVGARINASASATPNDTDFVATAEAAGSLKKITWANVKAFLKTYYDTVYTTTAAVATQITTALIGYLTSAAAAATYQVILISGTNLKTVNNISLLGAGDVSAGFTLSVICQATSQPQNTTRYFGNTIKMPTAGADISKIYFPRAGTIKFASIYTYASGVAGTNEAWSLYIRINNTTDVLIATVSLATAERVFLNTGLSTAVTLGDYFEIKSVAPVTWATAPTNVLFGGNIYVE